MANKLKELVKEYLPTFVAGAFLGLMLVLAL